MPLQTVHRPVTLDDVAGNETTVESLRSVLGRKKDKPHSFLFTGNSGCGKSTMVGILKNELKCSKHDFYEYNTSNTRGIDTIRDIIDNSQFAPMAGAVKLFVLEEAAGLTGPAQESLLVILENPPAHVFFALCTTEPEKLKPTIKRRCHTYDMKPLSTSQIIDLLNKILEKEGVADFPENVLIKIASVCDGSPGKALILLDTTIDVQDDAIAFQVIEDATVATSNIVEIARVLIKGGGEWQSIASMVKGLTGEPEGIRRAFLGYFKAVLLNNGSDRIANILEAFFDSCAYSGAGGLVLEIYRAWQRSVDVPF